MKHCTSKGNFDGNLYKQSYGQFNGRKLTAEAFNVKFNSII